jgi:hypothetical protein
MNRTSVFFDAWVDIMKEAEPSKKGPSQVDRVIIEVAKNAVTLAMQTRENIEKGNHTKQRKLLRKYKQY